MNTITERALAPLVWHYTTGPKIESIFRDFAILTEDETTGIIPGLPGGVWFSRRQDHEPTAVKAAQMLDGSIRQLSFGEMVEAVGAWRIGVDAASPFLLTWAQFSKRCTCDRRVLRGLVRAADDQGSDARTFLVSLRRVSLEECLAVEEYEGGQWVRRLPADSAPAEHHLAEEVAA